jgi:hypothetical protein
MEPESSVPRSQKPSTSSYPMLDESTPYLSFYFYKIPFNIILTSMSIVKLSL